MYKAACSHWERDSTTILASTEAFSPWRLSLVVLTRGKAWNDVPGYWVDMWRSGTFPKKLQVSVIPITNTYRGTTEHSTSDSLGDVSWVQKAALQLWRKNVPLLPTSTQAYRYVFVCDQFYQAFPCVSTASDKRWGEKAWVQGYDYASHCTG